MAIDVVSPTMDSGDQFVGYGGKSTREQSENSSSTSRTAASTHTRLRHWNLPVSPSAEYSTQPLPLGSSFTSMPIMGKQQSFGSSNSFSPYSSLMANSGLLSPSSPYSPASTTYSSSPMESPQHPNPYPQEEFLRYGLQQALHRHAVASHGYQPYGENVDAPDRRRRKDAQLSPGEFEKRRLRRERNKQAAWRCRTRRRERIEALEQETAEIEGQNSLVENEISNLKDELAALKKSLTEHECCRRKTTDTAKVNDVKVKQESS